MLLVSRIKKLLKISMVTLIVASFILPNLLIIHTFADEPHNNGFDKYMATIYNETDESNKPHGFKVEGAEYYEEMWDKFNVIAPDNGGGGGSGGAGRGNNATNAGNNGMFNDNGGVFGNAAGVGIGAGSSAGFAGSGSSNIGNGVGSSGSKMADAMRALKKQIEESQSQYENEILESAANRALIEASIEESKRIVESIQKALVKESIKSKIIETHSTLPINTVETQRQTTIAPTEIPSPTANVIISTTKAQTVPKEPIAVMTIQAELNRNEIITPIIDSPTAEPTTRQTEATFSHQNQIRNNQVGPGTFVEETVLQSRVDIQPQTEIFVPTAAQTYATEVSIIEPSARKIVESEEPIINIEDPGSGSTGGENNDLDQNKQGKQEDANTGSANGAGDANSQEQGVNKGKKVFEIDTTGDLGLNPDRLAITNMRLIMIISFMVLLILGIVLYCLNCFDKKNKNNYF